MAYNYSSDVPTSACEASMQAWNREYAKSQGKRYIPGSNVRYSGPEQYPILDMSLPNPRYLVRNGEYSHEDIIGQESMAVLREISMNSPK